MEYLDDILNTIEVAWQTWLREPEISHPWTKKLATAITHTQQQASFLCDLTQALVDSFAKRLKHRHHFLNITRIRSNGLEYFVEIEYSVFNTYGWTPCFKYPFDREHVQSEFEAIVRLWFHNVVVILPKRQSLWDRLRGRFRTTVWNPGYTFHTFHPVAWRVICQHDFSISPTNIEHVEYHPSIDKYQQRLSMFVHIVMPIQWRLKIIKYLQQYILKDLTLIIVDYLHWHNDIAEITHNQPDGSFALISYEKVASGED